MTRTAFAMGSATFLAVIVAGFLSAVWVDRHYAAAGSAMTSASACVSDDGSWNNWIWANVPMLSPKCPKR
ncbi:MAG TPA: hypothetical protein VNX23_21265 [Bradyrhizobium sp.]|jgi:hypothetical protein|uniref:hypothetical protein n=1 Tax=Bradyrhizobium sp. TaxID=376 RepID=UPI002B63D287|nr:hypothetical protein [Bradyrhizobium sp.]HXB79903.1 hypothetical protein [Bradyrhizobium sp.]